MQKKLKLTEAMEEEIDPRILAHGKNCYKRSIEAMNRPEENEQLNIKVYKNKK